MSLGSVKKGEMHAKCAMCGNEAIISDEHDSDRLFSGYVLYYKG
jgi:hypothetical protein